MDSSDVLTKYKEDDGLTYFPNTGKICAEADGAWNQYEITQEFPWDKVNQQQVERVEQLKGVIGRMGAKSKLRDWLIPRFPEAHTYVEPFGGSFKVLMWKTKRNKIEIINDVDHDLVHFFRYLTFYPNELARLINSMPLHQGLLEHLRDELRTDQLTGIERAAAVYYSLKLSFNGTGNGYAGSPTVLASARANPTEFRRVAERLKGVDIRAGDAHKLIRAINRQLPPDRYPGGIFFYLDPPYDETAGYSTLKQESVYGKEQQQELFMLANEIDAAGNKFMMTNSYTDWLRERWCKNPKWTFVKRDVQYTISGNADKRKEHGELIVANFDFTNKKKKEVQRGLFQV